MNLYLFALREHASKERLAEIDERLEAPLRAKVGGAPAWYGSDDDAWDEWAASARR